MVFGAVGNNYTFGQFGDQNNMCIDQRGFNTWIKGEASTFLANNDQRLLLNSIVSNIQYSSTGVKITHSNGCIQADQAIVTFSLGVLQHESVTFTPELPDWKKTAIEMFEMGTYTKIFLQFPYTFWDPTTQFMLYADPVSRGYYPLFQSLGTPGFLPGSNILFVVVVNEEAYRVERQSDATTKAEVMKVLRKMFPNAPDPIAFTYPRWSQLPWARGSFSNWPTGTTLEMHQNLRANVGRVWFAGEHTSAPYFGFMHGAWFEGRDVGNRVAGLVGGVCKNKGANGCGMMSFYDPLRGTTEVNEYNVKNGWDTSYKPYLG